MACLNTKLMYEDYCCYPILVQVYGESKFGLTL